MESVPPINRFMNWPLTKHGIYIYMYMYIICVYIYSIWVNYNDLTVLPHSLESWLVGGIISNGPTIQVSEILFHLPRPMERSTIFHG